MVEENKDNPKRVEYIDSDLFVPTNEWDKERFVGVYQCEICTGVVLKPVECSTPSCAMLYCEKCINAMREKECPHRCGSKVFNQPNRHMKSQLNEFKFKCQNQPRCQEIVPYHNYERHFSECKANKVYCQNPECIAQKKQVDDLLAKNES